MDLSQKIKDVETWDEARQIINNFENITLDPELIEPLVYFGNNRVSYRTLPTVEEVIERLEFLKEYGVDISITTGVDKMISDAIVFWGNNSLPIVEYLVDNGVSVVSDNCSVLAEKLGQIILKNFNTDPENTIAYDIYNFLYENKVISECHEDVMSYIASHHTDIDDIYSIANKINYDIDKDIDLYGIVNTFDLKSDFILYYIDKYYEEMNAELIGELLDNSIKKENMLGWASEEIKQNRKRLTNYLEKAYEDIAQKEQGIRTKKIQEEQLQELRSIEEEIESEQEQLLTEWESLCIDLENNDDSDKIERLIEIAESVDIDTMNRSKKEICDELRDQMNEIKNRKYKHDKLCDNDTNITGLDFDELPPSCVVNDGYNCFDVEEIVDNNLKENPYTRIKFDDDFMREVNSKVKECKDYKHMLSVHEKLDLKRMKKEDIYDELRDILWGMYHGHLVDGIERMDENTLNIFLDHILYYLYPDVSFENEEKRLDVEGEIDKLYMSGVELSNEILLKVFIDKLKKSFDNEQIGLAIIDFYKPNEVDNDDDESEDDSGSDLSYSSSEEMEDDQVQEEEDDIEEDQEQDNNNNNVVNYITIPDYNWDDQVRSRFRSNMPPRRLDFDGDDDNNVVNYITTPDYNRNDQVRRELRRNIVPRRLVYDDNDDDNNNETNDEIRLTIPSLAELIADDSTDDEDGIY